jgi:hypothetical protein
VYAASPASTSEQAVEKLPQNLPTKAQPCGDRRVKNGMRGYTDQQPNLYVQIYLEDLVLEGSIVAPKQADGGLTCSPQILIQSVCD